MQAYQVARGNVLVADYCVVHGCAQVVVPNDVRVTVQCRYIRLFNSENGIVKAIASREADCK